MNATAWIFLAVFWIIVSIIIMTIGERQREKTTMTKIDVVGRCRNVPNKFIAIMAAYNEEVLIESAVRSIYDLRIVDNIVSLLVVVNNTTDSTLEVLEEMAKGLEPGWLRTMNIPVEPAKKAGALNKGFDYLRDCYGNDFVNYGIVALDADTVMLSGTCEKAKEVFRLHPEAASLSVDYRLKPIREILRGRKPTLIQRVLYAFQRIEYAMERTFKEAQRPYIKVLSGTCTVFKASALLEVDRYYENVWPTDSLVEDYSLTRNLQALGFKTPGSNATSLTDAPMSVKSLYKQRYRWYLGTLLVLREDRRGVRDLFDYAKIFFQPVMLLSQLAVLSVAVLMLLGPNPDTLSWLIPTAVVGVANLLFFLRNAERDTTVFEIILVGVPFLLLFYALFIEAIYIKIIIDSFSIKNTRNVGW